MKIYFAFLLLFAQGSFSQKLSKTDKALFNGLKAHIAFLADDKLEGRRTGTPGEKLASTYLTEQFKLIGLLPKGDKGSYLQQFTINDGKQINNTTHLIINGNDLKVEEDFFPFSFSANGSLESAPVITFFEKDMPWFWDVREISEKNINNPHFNLIESIMLQAKDFADKGATALIIYNSSSVPNTLKFESKLKEETTKIPVIYITKSGREKYLQDSTAALDLKLKVEIEDKKILGNNVIGYIDNGAANTVIVGAHYDHIGYGEDRNSLWTGAPAIHNGADDNASGTAAVVELAKMLRKKNLKNNNYLFICFSGEELGLFGSKYFTENPTVAISAINYMINLDMIGRLNSSTKKISIGGYGTSPSWANLLSSQEKSFSVKFDSSGVGPSDHTSFYRKNIPVLFFFTGVHEDYHKPGDDIDKINVAGTLGIVKYIYKIIEKTNATGKLTFTKAEKADPDEIPRFTVTLGIMPDYSFNGTGVRADGIVEGKIADKAGIKAGDIITSLGENTVRDLTSYMKALSKFKKGDAVKVKVLRGKEELFFDVVF